MGQELSSEPSTLCVVPARGGSKGILRKNLSVLGSKTLLDWTLDALLSAKYPLRVVVSTDDPEIARVARRRAVEVRRRPQELASDSASTEEAITDVLKNSPGLETIETVLLAQVTSPFRAPGTVDGILSKLQSTGADSVVGVVAQSPFLWRYDGSQPEAQYTVGSRPRRQDIGPSQMVYRECGSLYAFRKSGFLATGNRIFGHIGLFQMSKLEGLDIDSIEDLTYARFALESGLWEHEIDG